MNRLILSYKSQKNRQLTIHKIEQRGNSSHLFVVGYPNMLCLKCFKNPGYSRIYALHFLNRPQAKY